MTDVATSQTRKNLIHKLWCGEIALVKTYWIYGALGSLAIRLLSPAITYLITSQSDKMSSFDVSVLTTIWFLIAISYSVFILVAIWRSANNYKKDKPDKAGNATVAQIMCILGWLALCGSAVKFFAASKEDEQAVLTGHGTADQPLCWREGHPSVRPKEW